MNDKTPKKLPEETTVRTFIFHHRTYVFLLIAYVLFKISQPAIFPKSSAQASDLSQQNILLAVNKERELRNLLTLKEHASLTVAAQSKSQDMIARHYFSHTDPEGNYVWNKIVAAGYTPYIQLGENLAIEFYNTESLISAWMNSPTHRANVLNEGFKDQGLGISFGNSQQGQYGSAIVNTFGSLALRPKPAPTPPAPTPGETGNSSSSPDFGAAPTPVAAPPAVPIEPSVETPPPPSPTKVPEASLGGRSSALPVAPSPAKSAIKPRESENNFDISPKNFFQAANETASTAPTLPAFNLTADGAMPKGQINTLDFSRYISLGFALLLLVFLLSDIRAAIKNQLAFVDKKINNLVVLLIALVIIALFYWL